MRGRPFALLAAVATLAGCGAGGYRGGAKASAPLGVLRLALTNSLTTLDPAKVQDVESIPVLNHVYETLLDYDEANRIVPRLASSFRFEDGGRTVRFTLADARFSSGRPVTSRDVKASFARALSPAVASAVAATYLGDIVGAKPNTGPLGIETPDDRTVVMRLVRPSGAFLGKLTYPAAAVVDPRASGPGEIVRPDQAIGSGPFRFAEVAADRRVRLAASESFRGPAPKLKEIVWTVVRDSATRLNLFRRGTLDIVGLDRGQIPGARADRELAPLIRAVPRPAVSYLLLNAKAYPPFRDASVRRAFAMAVDRERLTTRVLGSLEPAARWVPPSVLPGDPPKPLRYDPAAARAALGGRKLPPIELTVRADNPDSKAVAEAVAGDLKKNLGVEVRPNAIEWGALLRKRNRAELPMAFLNWTGDYNDPENFLSFLLRTDSGVNFDGWSNAEFDVLTARADAMPDGPARRSLYLQAEGIVLRELPRVPLYFGRDQLLVSRRLSGLRFNALGTMLHLGTEAK